jgi:hypothetical protein
MTSPRPDNGRTEQKRFTVHERALLLGLTVEAARKRAERGKLASVKEEDGTCYILLDDDQTKTGPGPVNDQTELVEALAGQIEFLREELAARNVELRQREAEYREESRRKDHLLAAALERIPAIEEAPSEPRESDVGASEERGTGDVPPEPEQRRSWLHRFFFGK